MGCVGGVLGSRVGDKPFDQRGVGFRVGGRPFDRYAQVAGVVDRAT